MREIHRILPLMISLRQELGLTPDLDELQAALEYLMRRRDGRLHIIGAYEGRFPVGYVAGSFSAGTALFGSVFLIREVFVARPFRGGGTLKALRNETFVYARNRDAIALEVTPARNDRRLMLLAEDLGFEPVGREVWELRIPQN